MKSWVSSHFRYIIIYLPETFQRFPNIISIIGQIFPILFYINVQFQRGSIWSAPGHRARMRSRHVSHSILWCHSRSLRPLAAPGPRTRSNSGDFRLWSMEVKHPNISYLFISHIPIDWGNGLTLGSSFQMFPGAHPFVFMKKFNIQSTVNCKKNCSSCQGLARKRWCFFNNPILKPQELLMPKPYYWLLGRKPTGLLQNSQLHNPIIKIPIPWWHPTKPHGRRGSNSAARAMLLQLGPEPSAWRHGSKPLVDP